MPEIFSETADQILDRYSENLSQAQLWQAELQDLFRWVIPNRGDLISSNTDSVVSGARFERGEDRFRSMFDTTGAEAVLEFANNFQLTLMPQFENWASIDTVDDIQELPQAFIDEFGEISDETLNDLKTQLANNTDILFRYLNDSNFSQATNEALQEYAGGTGAVILNEGDFANPLDFSSASITSIVIEEGPKNKIQNVWRNLHVKNRNIRLKWPNAKIPPQLMKQIENSPDQFTDMIEASVHYPQNPEGFQYYYMIIMKEKRVEIITEFREINPWIVFRFSKSPNETIGRGPALTALPKIRTINQLTEFALAGAKFNAYPAYTAPSSNEFNPYMLPDIRPGTIIPVGPEFAGTDVIRPIPGAQNPQFQEAMLERMQREIKEILFSNPLPTQGQPQETATLTNARAQQWWQKNGGAMARFGVEFTQRAIDSSVHILTKKGIMPLLSINNKKFPMRLNSRLLKLSLTNPLSKGKKQEEAQAISQAVQFAQQTFGGLEGLLTLDIGTFPEEFYEAINVPQKLINPDFKNSPLVQAIQNSIQQQPGQQGAGGPQPGPVGQTSPQDAAGLGAGGQQ